MSPSDKVPSTSIEPLKTNPSTSVPPTISPQDTCLEPVNQVRSPGVQNFNTNTTSAGTSISPVRGPVVSQPANLALGLRISTPLHQIQSLKRDSPTQSEGHYDTIEQLQKRPRLEGPHIELATNIPIEPVADDTEDTIQMDIEEDEDFIEVGPDGLRLVNDCIFDLFGEEDGEGRYCKLCMSVSYLRLSVCSFSFSNFYFSARCDMGYHVDPLKPFVNATNDELLEHCMTEHAEAWDALRHSV